MNFFSGFILSYALLKSLDKTRGRFNYFNFLFQRWVRFTLLFFGSILFFYLFPLFGDGPLWEYGLQWITPGCENSNILLKSFLSINNFDERVTPTTHQNVNIFSYFKTFIIFLKKFLSEPYLEFFDSYFFYIVLQFLT